MSAVSTDPPQNANAAPGAPDRSTGDDIALADVIRTYESELDFFNKNAQGTKEENDALAERTYMIPRRMLANWHSPASHDMEALAALNFAGNIIGANDGDLKSAMIAAAFGFLDRSQHSSALEDVIAWWLREEQY